MSITRPLTGLGSPADRSRGVYKITNGPSPPGSAGQPVVAGTAAAGAGIDVVHFFLVFCVGVVVATVASLVWNYLLRPVFYTSGWVRSTAHDLEVEGWQAEGAGDVQRALQKYAESLTLDPRNPHLLARFEALLDANDWVRIEWPDPPPGAG